MSVQMNQYLVYGYLLPMKESDLAISSNENEMEAIHDKYYDSAFNKTVVAINGCSLISDGASGEYNFFGKVFQKSEEGEPLHTTEMPKVTAKIKKNVDSELHKIFDNDFGVKPKLLLLTHYR